LIVGKNLILILVLDLSISIQQILY